MKDYKLNSVFWKHFECKRCGKCCEGDLPWDPWRIEEMASFKEMSVTEFCDKYYGTFLPDGSLKFDESKRTPCPFCEKSKDGKFDCAIYEVRPFGCRLFPFESDGGTAGIDCEAARIARESYKKDNPEI